MSLDKAIKHKKEKRKEYYSGSKRFDRTCRNHGKCSWCARGRKHRARRQEPIDQLTE